MKDKSKELEAKIRLVNDRLNFHCEVEGNSKISVDYIPPLGDNLGYTSLELFLISFSTCLGSAIVVLLRKMQKNFNDFEITAKGIRNETHPTCFKTIIVNIKLESNNITEEDLKKTIAISEESICPVWAMIKGNVNVEFEYNIKSN